MNKVCITGKVSRLGSLKYTPSGMAILEFTLAAPQEAYDKPSVGYYEVLLTGALAEDSRGRFKIGTNVSVEGHLYQRSYRNRAGNRVSETKIIFEKFGGEK